MKIKSDTGKLEKRLITVLNEVEKLQGEYVEMTLVVDQITVQDIYRTTQFRDSYHDL